jgi:galactonate dehydratase
MSAIVDVAVFSVGITAQTVWTFVRVSDDGGRSGWGEATLHGESNIIHAHIDRLRPAFVGQSLASLAEAATVVGGYGNTPAESAAISAIDQACADIRAKANGRPLAEALGTSRRSTIELYANINRGTTDRSPSGFATRGFEAAKNGFNAIKIAPFDDVRPENVGTPSGRALLAQGVERIAAVRSAIGANRALLVDCHWRLTEETALALLRELEPFRLYWFECPLAEEPSMFPALRRIRSRANELGVRLAGCETLTGLTAFESFLNAGVYDVIMPDVKYAGGLIELLRIDEAAARRGVLCSPHNPTGPIAHLHSVHVSALLSAFPFLELQFGESPLFFEILDCAIPDPLHGTSELPRAHGLGAGLDIHKLSSVPVDHNAADAPLRRS